MVLACIVGCGVAAGIRGIPAGVVTGCPQRTLSAAPAWMRGAILPCAPQATLQPNHTLPLFLAGVSESDTPCIPGKSSWGKILHEGGVRSCAPPPKLFCPGEGVARNAAHTHPPRPCAQAFRWSSLPAGTQSASLLLHFGHRLATMAGMAKASGDCCGPCNTAQSPRCGWMWSTSVAGVRSPRRAHSPAKRAREGAVQAAGPPSTLESGTSSARTWPHRCGCPWGGGDHNSRQ